MVTAGKLKINLQLMRFAFQFSSSVLQGLSIHVAPENPNALRPLLMERKDIEYLIECAGGKFSLVFSLLKHLL